MSQFVAPPLLLALRAYEGVNYRYSVPVDSCELIYFGLDDLAVLEGVDLKNLISFMFTVWCAFMSVLIYKNDRHLSDPLPETCATIWLCPDPDGSKERPFRFNELPAGFYNRSSIHIWLREGVYHPDNSVLHLPGDEIVTVTGVKDKTIIETYPRNYECKTPEKRP